MLWCTGTNDHFFPLDSLTETALASGNALLSIKVRMRHGQKEGDVPEIRAFADSIVKGAPKLTDRCVIRREWVYTDSAERNWEKRLFRESPQCPKSSTIRFENKETEDGLILSSVPTFGVAEARPEELVDCPVSENFQGKENISWSKAYAYGQTDEMKDLPRVLLIGDSICNGYQDRVRQLLHGKMNVTYWASSYSVLHPGYTWLLSFYLSENEYDVIHINNGLHSLYAQPDEWGRALKSVMELIRRRQPKAKLVWASSTPLADAEKTEKVKLLNAVAAKVVAGMPDIETDDLFSLVDTLDRGRFGSDPYHFKRPAVEMLAKQVAACSLRMAGLSDGTLSARGVSVNGNVVEETEWRHEADGCAVRYRLPNGKRRISGEDTVWTMPEDARCWYQVQAGAYEKPYAVSKVGDVPKGKTLCLPITFKLADGSYRMIIEANFVDYTDLGVVYEGKGRFRAVYHAEKGPFEQAGANTTPWRVMIKAKSLDELYNCDLVRRLCPEPTNEKSIALHRPGRCIWQWLPAGDPVYADQKEWYDKTAALGFKYYLIDDGWKKWRDGDKDQWACLKSVIDYGKLVGVKSAMWVDSKEMPTAERRRAYLKKVVAAGAVGIKIDFIPPCDSKWCKWYEETLADTAELGLFVDFHGAVKPAGREKTWPHEMSREAVRGHEWHITRYKRVLPHEHDTILPFCRLVQGHADYTPLVLQKDQLVHFTWAREVAQAVVMLAPFLCLGDFPQNYIDSPMAELIRALPAEYDRSVVLPGSEIGECVAVARYSKGRWFVAVENGSQTRHLKIPLSFLGQGPWRLLGFRDAPDGRLDNCRREDRIVNALDAIELDVRPGGGYVAGAC